MSDKFILVSGNSGDYFISPLFDKYKIPHMFATRNGGVSGGEFYSFNFAAGQGDIQDLETNVETNYKIAAKAFNCDSDDICKGYQLHTNTVEIVRSENRGTIIGSGDRGVDGLITGDRDVLLSVRTADCVPVLLYDIDKDICAGIHSGWRGSVRGIVAAGINALKTEFSSCPSKIIAAIGPCAGGCCYEVGEEVLDEFIKLDREFAEGFEFRDGRIWLNLTRIIVKQLLLNGLDEKNISAANICTICNPELFFSHRRQGIIRGTMGVFIKTRI